MSMARMGDLTKDFEKLQLKQGETELWEDGMRTDGKSGSYEWWYTDAEFPDGCKVVIVYYTKAFFDVKGDAHPTANITITFPDGSSLSETIQDPVGTIIDAKKDSCLSKIDGSYIKREEDGSYTVYFKNNHIEYKALMSPLMQPWRPKTGHMFFGDSDEKFFAWFVAVPSAKITATLTVDGKSTQLIGSGYHDHNWGNAPMNDLINHWYWGRAKIGEYNVIACDIIAEKKYGYKRLPIMMIAKDGKIISDDERKTKIQRLDTVQHPITKKFMDNHLLYLQQESDVEYKIQFIRKQDTSCVSLMENMSAFIKTMGKLLGMNPTYTRISGDVSITVTENGESTTTTQTGLWEQMFFGKNKDATIGE